MVWVLLVDYVVKKENRVVFFIINYVREQKDAFISSVKILNLMGGEID